MDDTGNDENKKLYTPEEVDEICLRYAVTYNHLAYLDVLTYVLKKSKSFEAPSLRLCGCCYKGKLSAKDSNELIDKYLCRCE